MLFRLVQVLPAAVDPSHLIEALGLGVAYGVGKWFDHRKGQKRDTRGDVNAATLSRIEGKVENVTKDVDDLTGDVRDLRAHIVGPDGQNGLRGDVRELKEDVKGILHRERDRAEDRLHGEYRK